MTKKTRADARIEEAREEEILPPCPKCMRLAMEGKIRNETVQPLPSTRAIMCPTDKKTDEPICRDCNAAWLVLRLSQAPTWEAARIAVANDRQEQLRLPGVLMGLVKAGIVLPSKPGDLERHHRWLDHYNWFRPEENNAT